MNTRDPHRFSNELDHAASERIIARLESRAKDKVFSSLFDKYIPHLALPPSAQVLEIGCGTGAMTRFLHSAMIFLAKRLVLIKVLLLLKRQENSRKRKRSAIELTSV